MAKDRYDVPSRQSGRCAVPGGGGRVVVAVWVRRGRERGVRGNESWLAACRVKDQLQPGDTFAGFTTLCSRNGMLPVYVNGKASTQVIMYHHSTCALKFCNSICSEVYDDRERQRQMLPFIIFKARREKTVERQARAKSPIEEVRALGRIRQSGQRERLVTNDQSPCLAPVHCTASRTYDTSVYC